MIEINRETVRTAVERAKEYRRYAPVVGMCLLLLFSAIGASVVYTQPVDTDRPSTVSAQSAEENAVYIGGINGRLWKYDKDINKQWNITLDKNEGVNSIEKDPTRDVVYASSSGDNVYAVYSNGTVKWSNLQNNNVWGASITPDGETLYVADGQSIKTFDPETGTEQNTIYTHGARVIEIAVGQESGDIYSLSYTDNMVRVSESGTVKWTDTVQTAGRFISVSNSENRVATGIKNSSDIHEVQIRDASDGTIQDNASLPFNDEITTGDISNDDSTVYIGYHPYNLAAYNMNTSTFEYDKSYSTDIGVEEVRVTLDNKSVIMVGSEATVDRINRTTGTREQSVSTVTRYLISASTGSEHYASSSAAPTAFDPELQVETRNYLKHGNSSDYQVYYTDPDTGNTSEVTNDSGLTVSSSNTTVFTLNTTSNRVIATSNESINAKENLTAEYEGLTQKKNITVANATVDNLEILPGITRVEATYSDSNIVLILIATMLGVVATRASSAFAGIAAIQLTLVAGFFVDLISLGVVLVGLFGALFIGLNLAANIDYTVRG